MKNESDFALALAVLILVFFIISIVKAWSLIHIALSLRIVVREFQKSNERIRRVISDMPSIEAYEENEERLRRSEEEKPWW